MEYDKNNKGSLWKQQSKKGTWYYSGTATIENHDYKVSMFVNDKKGNDKRPDFNLVFEEVKPKEEESDPYKDFSKEIKDDEIEIDNDSLPF